VLAGRVQTTAIADKAGVRGPRVGLLLVVASALQLAAAYSGDACKSLGALVQSLGLRHDKPRLIRDTWDWPTPYRLARSLCFSGEARISATWSGVSFVLRPATSVLSGGDGLKMVGVHASGKAAQMVDLQAPWDRPLRLFVVDPVS
jgi:hypothetical protein